jgi:O-antigen/teichoic acid export membrane protein
VSSTVNPQTRLVSGTVLVLAAEALAFPAGLIATILLTHYLVPADYGALALALAGVAWLEWTVVSLFSRAAWKLIAEAADWRLVVAPVVRTFLLTSVLVALFVFATAGVAASVLGIPQLTSLLRVLAIEIPIFATAHAYRTVLVGRGMHGSRAIVAAGRWVIRALLIAAGALLGFSLIGIALLIVAATFVELAIARVRAVGLRLVQPSQMGPQITTRALLTYATPLALSAICMRLFERIDIFALRILGGSLPDVAAYGVAQNLSLGPGLFGAAFAPALIAAVSYRLAHRDGDGVRRLGGEALRAGFLVLSVTLLAAGAAPALIDLMFGVRYAAAAPLFALLILGAAGTLLIALAGGILVGAGQLRWTVILTAPLLLVAVIGHLIMVPRLGAIGAATVTAGTSLFGAVASCAAARVLVGARVPVATLLRALVIGGAAAATAYASRVRGAAVLPELLLILVLIIVALLLTGELKADERARFRQWLRVLRPATAAQVR